MVGILFLVGFRVDGPSVMLAQLFALAVVSSAVFISLKRSLLENLRTVPARYRDREWVLVALPLFVISGMGMVLNQADIVIVGAWLGTTKAGVYSAASRVAGLILFGLASTNVILGPMISQLYATGKQLELQRILLLATKGISAFSIPAAVLLVAFGKKILALFGSAFSEGYVALVILVVAQLVNALAGSVGLLMMMTAHEKQAAIIIGTAAVLNIVLNVILIPRFGIAGAALATGATIILWNVWMLIYVQKQACFIQRQK